MISPIFTKFTLLTIADLESQCYSYQFDLNHTELNKYDTPEDKNYQLVRERLRTVVDDIVKEGTRRIEFEFFAFADLLAAKDQENDDMLAIEQGLEIVDDHIPRLHAIYNKTVKGSCEWLRAHDAFVKWRRSPQTRFLWLSGPPGTGKTILTATVAQYLKDAIRLPCCVFFCEGEGEQRPSLSGLLKCFAYQIAKDNKEIRACLKDLAEKVLPFLEDGSDSADIVYKRVFKDCIFKKPPRTT